MVKLKALSATARTDWANAHLDSDKHKLNLYDNFILRCPIPGVSHSGSPTLAMSRTDEQLSIMEIGEITAGIKQEYFFSSFELRQVAKWLIEHKYDNNKVPTGATEFICMSITPERMLKRCYKLFPDIDAKDLRASERNRYKNLLCLDALYRHIRNSLAHGLYKEVRRKSPDGKRRPYLFFQDNNSSHQITARMFLSYERLDRWASKIANLKTEG